MKFLFVGGPADGQWIAVSQGDDGAPPPRHTVAEHFPADHPEAYSVSAATPLRTQTYHRVPLQEARRIHYVYTLRDREGQVLHDLMRGYGR